MIQTTMIVHPLPPQEAVELELELASWAETAARDSLGVRMYNKYAEDSHRPSVLMRWSGTPAAAAEVAAPMRKLCPEYWAGSRPAARSARLTPATNWLLSRGEPSAWTNRGPPAVGRSAR